MLVDADFGAARPAEVSLNNVSARAIEAVCLLIDRFDLETFMEIVP